MLRSIADRCRSLCQIETGEVYEIHVDENGEATDPAVVTSLKSFAEAWIEGSHRIVVDCEGCQHRWAGVVHADGAVLVRL